jgi:hypothetical protein
MLKWERKQWMGPLLEMVVFKVEKVAEAKKLTKYDALPSHGVKPT